MKELAPVRDNLSSLEVSRTSVPLGTTEVEIVTHETGAPGFTYLSVHENENTAVAATLGTLRRRGGRLVRIRHTGERNLTFVLEDGGRYAFDPNRIFTDDGARATLHEQGAFSEGAFAATRGFAERLLAVVDLDALEAAGEPIVTVHNNKPGVYSARSYAVGGDHEQEAERMKPKRDTTPDDFFFVTERDYYDRLQGGPFHVVLQDNAAMTDDGSFSVYAARRGLAYVNVEARHGHLRQQIDMLDFLCERVKK